MPSGNVGPVSADGATARGASAARRSAAAEPCRGCLGAAALRAAPPAYRAAGQVAIGTVRVALSNVLGKPEEPKFRRLKGSNARVQRELLSHPEGVELLCLAGWLRESGDGGHGDLVLPEKAPLGPLREVLAALPNVEAAKRPNGAEANSTAV